MTDDEAEQINPGEGRANQEIGGPGEGSRGPWSSRGYLPHFEGALAIQHVTFHLADSLPKAALERMDAEIRCVPFEKQDEERRKRLEAWMDAGHGSCVLRETGIAEMVQKCLLHFDGERYFLLAWVVMPNHVHALFQPSNGWSVGKIVASRKKFTARGICEYWRETGRGEANREIGYPGGPVWHREYWDRYIRNEWHFHEKKEYIHQNPVVARLVACAEDWPWSSASRDRQSPDWL